MKPLFYLLLVICFSTIFSCKKEKIAQTPTPASPTTIVPNATEQQLVGVWRFVKGEIYDNNVLVHSSDSTASNYMDSLLFNDYTSDYIEFTNQNNFTPQANNHTYMLYNYYVLSNGIFNTGLAFYVTLAGDPDDANTIINTSTYDSFSSLPPLWPGGVDNGMLHSLGLPNYPPLTTNQLNSIYNVMQSAGPIKYIRVLDAHNLVVSSWGDNVFADGIKTYYCR